MGGGGGHQGINFDSKTKEWCGSQLCVEKGLKTYRTKYGEQV